MITFAEAPGASGAGLDTAGKVADSAVVERERDASGVTWWASTTVVDETDASTVESALAPDAPCFPSRS